MEQTQSTVATIPPPQLNVRQGVFESAEKFTLAQRIAQCLVTSTMVPERYRGEANIGNAVIALDIAARIGLPPLMVMQHLFVVYGNPSFSGQMIIALINGSGMFTEPLEYETKGSKGNDDWGCRCYATTKSGKKVFGPWVDIAMSKAEGWFDRKDRDGKFVSKWRTIPEMMLRYRAAAYFGRTVCPDVTIGLRTVDEEEELVPGKEINISPVAQLAGDSTIPTLEATGPATDIVPPRRMKRVPVKPVEPKAATQEAAPTPEPVATTPPPSEPVAEQKPKPEPAAEVAPVLTIGEMTIQIAEKLQKGGVSTDDFFDWVKSSGRNVMFRCDPDAMTDISELPAPLLEELLKGSIEKCIKIMGTRPS